MSEIVALDTPKKQAFDDCINVIKKVLAYAESGDISGVGIAFVTLTGGVNSAHSATTDAGALLGAISLLNYRLNRAIADEHNV